MRACGHLYEGLWTFILGPVDIYIRACGHLY